MVQTGRGQADLSRFRCTCPNAGTETMYAAIEVILQRSLMASALAADLKYPHTDTRTAILHPS